MVSQKGQNVALECLGPPRLGMLFPHNLDFYLHLWHQFLWHTAVMPAQLAHFLRYTGPFWEPALETVPWERKLRCWSSQNQFLIELIQDVSTTSCLLLPWWTLMRTDAPKIDKYFYLGDDMLDQNHTILTGYIVQLRQEILSTSLASCSIRRPHLTCIFWIIRGG